MYGNVFYCYSIGGRKAREKNIVNGFISLPLSREDAEFVVCSTHTATKSSPQGQFVQTSGTCPHETHLRDHLGNTRLAYIHEGTTITKAQTTHYYPFGMKITPLSNQPVNLGTERNNAFLYNGKEFNDDMGLNWYDYGARFYDAQIGRFHSVDPLAEVYSFQSPFAYAANNPIYYVDYMGLGPKEWWESIRGWFRDKILNQTPTAGLQRVKPAKEMRTVVYSKEYNMTPSLYNWSNFNLAAFLRDDPDDGLGWVRDYSYYSSFDESYRSNIRSQGVRFNERPLPGREVRQVWQRRPFTGRARILIGPNDRGRLQVSEHIRRFLGLNMGNRTHIAFYGLNPPRTRVGNLTHEEINSLIENRILLEVTPRHYYQQVLRLHGTRAYFEELERAGIIEPMNANP